MNRQSVRFRFSSSDGRKKQLKTDMDFSQILRQGWLLPMRNLAISCVFCLAVARATVIASVPAYQVVGDGTVIGNVGGSDEYLFVTWTSTTGYTGVSIDAWIFGSGQGTAYSEVDSTTFNFAPLSSASATILFTGLNLGPATYYLVIASTSASLDSWTDGITPYVTAPGVTVSLGGQTNNLNGVSEIPDDAYPPGSTWGCCDRLAFDVVSNAPEPSTFGSTTAPLVLLPVFLLLRRCSSRQRPIWFDEGPAQAQISGHRLGVGWGEVHD